MSRVKVDVEMNKSKFDAGADAIKGSVEGLKHLIEGAFVVEGIKSLIEKTFDYGEEIENAAVKTHLSTDEVQALGIAARDAGSSLDKITEAYEKIEIAKAKALSGDKESLLGLSQFGLKATDSTLDMLGTIGTKAGTGDNKAKVGMSDLGLRGVAGDLTALGDSAKITQQRIQELKDNGQIMSADDLAKLHEAKIQMSAIGDELITTFAPMVAKIAPMVILGVLDIIDNFKLLFDAIVKMAEDTTQYIENLKKNGKVNAEILGTSGLQGFEQGIVGGNPLGGIIGGVGAMLNTPTIGNTQTLGDSLSGTWNDMVEKMIEKDGNNSDQMDKSLANILKKLHQTDSADDNKQVIKSNLKPSMYSDELTKGGNFLGASFGQAGLAASALDYQKRLVDKSDAIYQQAVKQNATLDKMLDKIQTKDGGDWTADFN